MKVAVIMSTYNGEKYIREQIDSILSQLDVNVELFIRDDGSSDSTVNIIREYERKYENIHLDEGKNLGFAMSFIKELKSVKGYDYYAFSDQDDYWEEKKLFYGCLKLAGEKDEKPAIYYSNLNVADANLKVYRKTELQKRRKSLESIFLRRSIAGCTMVFNKYLWQEIAKSEISSDMLKCGHDSFILSLCYALRGNIFFDENAYIRYRQHGANTSGSSHGIVQRIKKEWKMMWKKKGKEIALANGIMTTWNNDIGIKEKKILELIIESSHSIKPRLIIFFSKDFVTGNFFLTAVGKIKVLFGLL